MECWESLVQDMSFYKTIALNDYQLTLYDNKIPKLNKNLSTYLVVLYVWLKHNGIQYTIVVFKGFEESPKFCSLSFKQN